MRQSVSLLIAVALLCGAFAVNAAEKSGDVRAKIGKKWTPFEMNFFPGAGFPGDPDYSMVKGWKFGFPISGGYGFVYGLEGSLFAATTDNFKGVQGAAFYAATNDGEGIQGALITKASGQFAGVQGALVNIAENKSDTGFSGVQFGLVNIVENMDGMQFGLVNIIKSKEASFIPFFNFKFAD